MESKSYNYTKLTLEMFKEEIRNSIFRTINLARKIEGIEKERPEDSEETVKAKISIIDKVLLDIKRSQEGVDAYDRTISDFESMFKPLTIENWFKIISNYRNNSVVSSKPIRLNKKNFHELLKAICEEARNCNLLESSHKKKLEEALKILLEMDSVSKQASFFKRQKESRLFELNNNLLVILSEFMNEPFNEWFKSNGASQLSIYSHEENGTKGKIAAHVASSFKLRSLVKISKIDFDFTRNEMEIARRTFELENNVWTVKKELEQKKLSKHIQVDTQVEPFNDYFFKLMSDDIPYVVDYLLQLKEMLPSIDITFEFIKSIINEDNLLLADEIANYYYQAYIEEVKVKKLA